MKSCRACKSVKLSPDMLPQGPPTVVVGIAPSLEIPCGVLGVGNVPRFKPSVQKCKTVTRFSVVKVRFDYVFTLLRPLGSEELQSLQK